MRRVAVGGEGGVGNGTQRQGDILSVMSSEASPPTAGKVWFLEYGLPPFSFNCRAHAKKPCLIMTPLSDMQIEHLNGIIIRCEIPLKAGAQRLAAK